jgi:hypothetical protein
LGFTFWSDIDLASRGIPSWKYLAARNTVLFLSPEIKIDLVGMETCSPALLEIIEEEGMSPRVMKSSRAGEGSLRH